MVFLKENNSFLSGRMPQMPKVSIIIPTLNEGKMIANVLNLINSLKERLFKEQIISELETIIVDGGSTNIILSNELKWLFYAWKMKDRGSINNELDRLLQHVTVCRNLPEEFLKK